MGSTVKLNIELYCELYEHSIIAVFSYSKSKLLEICHYWHFSFVA